MRVLQLADGSGFPVARVTGSPEQSGDPMKADDDSGTSELFPDAPKVRAPATIRDGQPDLFGPDPLDPFGIKKPAPQDRSGQEISAGSVVEPRPKAHEKAGG